MKIINVKFIILIIFICSLTHASWRGYDDETGVFVRIENKFINKLFQSLQINHCQDSKNCKICSVADKIKTVQFFDQEKQEWCFGDVSTVKLSKGTLTAIYLQDNLTKTKRLFRLRQIRQV